MSVSDSKIEFFDLRSGEERKALLLPEAVRIAVRLAHVNDERHAAFFTEAGKVIVIDTVSQTYSELLGSELAGSHSMSLHQVILVKFFLHRRLLKL